MKIEHDYKNYRISASAVSADGLWNAGVRIIELFTFGQTKPYVEIITCRKPTARVAEERAAIYARRWVDRHGDSRIAGGRP